MEHATISFRGPRHLWLQILRLRGLCPTQSCSCFCPDGLQQQAHNLIYLSQCDLPLSPVTFFHLFPGPALPRLQLRRERSDSASVKVKCFYCSRSSLSLTSSCSALPSLQKHVPWDPSAPLLDGTSDTSGKQEWIKSPCVYKCIWKMSRASWSCATNPRWHAGNICPAKPPPPNKQTKKINSCEDVIDIWSWDEVRAD